MISIISHVFSFRACFTFIATHSTDENFKNRTCADLNLIVVARLSLLAPGRNKRLITPAWRMPHFCQTGLPKRKRATICLARNPRSICRILFLWSCIVYNDPFANIPCAIWRCCMSNTAVLNGKEGFLLLKRLGQLRRRIPEDGTLHRAIDINRAAQKCISREAPLNRYFITM